MMELFERLVAAMELQAKASMLQAELMAKMSYPAAPVEPTQPAETKRGRKPKQVEPPEEEGAPTEEEEERIPSKEELNAVCKELAILLGGKREPIEAIIKKITGGTTLLRDAEEKHLPKIYKAIQEAIEKKKGAANAA